MNITIFISLLFVFQFFYWMIGKRASKDLKCKEDYFFAGKNIRFFPLMMTFFATHAGGGLILGAAEEAYKFGWTVLLYPFGSAFGLILIGIGIGRKLANFKVATIAQIFEKCYQSVILKKIASIFSIVSLFMILVAQIIASKKFLISMGLNNQILFIIFWSIVIIYTAQGGLKAVISTDMFQAVFFSVILIFCFCFIFYSDTSIISSQVINWKNFSYPSSKVYGWLLMPLLFLIIEQDVGQRCFAGHSNRTVSFAAISAGISIILICIISVSFGILAKNIDLEISDDKSILMQVIITKTNSLISALVGCAILAAIISTASSLINAINSNLSNDFKIPFIQKTGGIHKIQILTYVISISAIFFAFYFNNIVNLLIQSYELSVSCLFIPIFIVLFKKRGNFLSALLSIIFGAVGFFLFRIYIIKFPKEIASIILSLIGYGCGEIFGKKITNRETFLHRKHNTLDN